MARMCRLKIGGRSLPMSGHFNWRGWEPLTICHRSSAPHLANNMASSYSQTEHVEPLDLKKWRPVPTVLIAVGAIGVLIGLAVGSLRQQFLFSWLTAYMFYLSFVLGGMFLVIVHHLTDANWSVPIRRINENLACLSWVMPLL